MIELQRLAVLGRQRRKQRRPRGTRTVLPRERLKRAARPHFEQHQRALEQMPPTFREANGLAHLARPIGRIDSVRTRDLRPGEAGYPGLAGSLGPGWADYLLEGFGDRIHRRRMERVRRLEPTMGDR